MSRKDSHSAFPLDPAGWPFILASLVLAALAAIVSGWVVATPFVGLAIVFLFFFRDPERHPPDDPSVVVSPADGRVLVAGPADASAPPGTWLQISIFLSPLDVHVNRVPVSGEVMRVDFRRGRYLPAYHPEATASNECSEIWITHDGQPVVVRQLVGVLARRVVCRLEPGRLVKAGDRFGVMKFGSRMDIFLPTTAILCVSVGDRVRGGETVLARL